MGQALQLLPPARDRCPICATAHDPEQPHNGESLYYQMRFRARHGRDATWADATAHCRPEIRGFWEQELRRLGHWTEPTGDVIADPPGESLRELVSLDGED